VARKMPVPGGRVKPGVGGGRSRWRPDPPAGIIRRFKVAALRLEYGGL